MAVGHSDLFDAAMDVHGTGCSVWVVQIHPKTNKHVFLRLKKRSDHINRKRSFNVCAWCT